MRRVSVNRRCLAFTLALLLSASVVHSDEQDHQLGVAREMVGLLEAYAVYKMGQYDLAFERFERLAENGSLKAMYNLGNMYKDGLSVAKNEEKAFEWYLKAAQAGDELSMEAAANAFAKGAGVEPSPEKARYWRTQADEASRQ